MIKVFVIILNWNRGQDTASCLKSFDKKVEKGITIELLVVDNASDDDSVEIIENITLDNYKVKIIKNKDNLGFSRGNNVGIIYSLKNKADYILVVNNDTEINEGLIENLVEEMEKDEDIGVISPKIYFAKGYEFHKKRYKKSDWGKIIWYTGGQIDWKNILGSNRGVDEVDKGQYDKQSNTDFATGACSMLRSKALKEVGFFDEKYFMYLEDMDLSQRLIINGWKVIYSPKGFLWHKVAQSSAIGSGLNDYYITRNKMLFGLRYASFRTKLAVLKEGVKLLISGRKWQKVGARDYFLGRFGKGSWE